MIGLRTKREEKFPSANLEDLIVLLKLAIASSLWSETGKIKYDLSTSRFTEHETTTTPIFDPSTDF